MSKNVKCPVCGTYNEKENAVLHKSRYLCPVCYENKQKSAEDYKNLITYICELYGLDAPGGRILKQIKEYKEDWNYTYIGMRSTLHYFYEIQENEITEGTGIGIVPFVYEEAREFYMDKKAVKDSLCDCEIEHIIQNKKVIHIEPADPDAAGSDEIALIHIEDL